VRAAVAVDASPDAELARRELGVALEAAIDALDPSMREVIVLRDVEGLSASEVARVVGTSAEAVKSRLHRARAALRARLEPHLGRGVPTVPSDPACPDIVDVLSRHLEGDASSDACAAMEAHLERCASCSAACGSLRRAVALCAMGRQAGLSDADARRVRGIVERVVSDARHVHAK
jgi:RNA polymerase sigma-70 factor (ECF subfamily)